MNIAWGRQVYEHGVAVDHASKPFVALHTWEGGMQKNRQGDGVN